MVLLLSFQKKQSQLILSFNPDRNIGLMMINTKTELSIFGSPFVTVVELRYINKNEK